MTKFILMKLQLGRCNSHLKCVGRMLYRIWIGKEPQWQTSIRCASIIKYILISSVTSGQSIDLTIPKVKLNLRSISVVDIFLSKVDQISCSLLISGGSCRGSLWGHASSTPRVELIIHFLTRLRPSWLVTPSSLSLRSPSLLAWK